MLRNRFARFVSFACCISVTSVYVPFLVELSKNFGFWYLVPVWACFIVGMVAIFEWIESRLEVSRDPSTEVHNSNFPLPSVQASGWHANLLASEASVSEAFRKMAGRRDSTIGLVCENGTELIAEWGRKGWTIEALVVGSGVRKVAVKSVNRWAGKEVRIRSLLHAFFKRTPKDWFDENTAKGIVGSFLGWNDLPPDVAWASIRYR